MIRPPAYSDMLQNYYEAKFLRLRTERRARLAAVATPEEACNYAARARRTLREAFLLPEERTPLQARVTADMEEDGVLAEAVLFEPRPCYLASALLYRPAGEVAVFCPSIVVQLIWPPVMPKLLLFTTNTQRFSLR